MKTLACCVGINQFKNFPGNGLKGCVNDAFDMAKWIDATFDMDYTSVLQEKAATRANILGSWNQIVQQANADKQVNRIVFSLSSHGSQTRDRDGDEADKKDECFITYDTAIKGGDFNRKTLILDDDLFELVSKVSPRVIVEIFLDTCHSGTGIRLLQTRQDVRYRFLPNPFLHAEKTVKKLKMRKQPANVILWAMCKASQTSADAYIGGDYHGAGTYAFLQGFGPKKQRITILRAAQKWLNDNDMEQDIQLECSDELKTLTF